MSKKATKDPALGRRISELHDSVGGSQADFGARFGVEQATVSRWRSGFVPKRTLWADIAALAGKSVQDFFFGETRRVPLVSKAAASTFRMAEDIISQEDVEKWIGYSDLEKGDWIAIPVDGSSMDRIAPDGSIIFVDRSDFEPKHEGFYVFRIGDETTFKRYLSHPTRLEPHSTEAGHQTIFPDDDRLQCIGRVRRVIVSL